MSETTVTVFGDTINLTQLLTAVPKAAQPWVQQNGQFLLQLAVDQGQAAFNEFVGGNVEAAQQAINDAMTPDQKDAKAQADLVQAGKDADAAAANVANERQAAKMMAGVVLSIALALVGL